MASHTNNFATKADIARLEMLIDSLVVGVIVTAIRVWFPVP